MALSGSDASVCCWPNGACGWAHCGACSRASSRPRRLDESTGELHEAQARRAALHRMPDRNPTALVRAAVHACACLSAQSAGARFAAADGSAERDVPHAAHGRTRDWCGGGAGRAAERKRKASASGACASRLAFRQMCMCAAPAFGRALMCAAHRRWQLSNGGCHVGRQGGSEVASTGLSRREARGSKCR